MSVRSAFTGTLVVALAWLSVARAQTPPQSPLQTLPQTLPRSGNGTEGLAAPRMLDTPPTTTPILPGDLPLHPPAGPSSWIIYERPSCEGPMGGTPIMSELYFRSGASFPTGGEIIGKLLQPGWMIGGGARALFFNPSMDAAWTIDAGISNTRNHSSRSDFQIPLTILVPNATGGASRVNFGNDPGVPGVTLREYNRTTVNLSFGREYYLWGSAAECGERNLRVGWDGGGRYGSASAQFREIRHRTDVIGGVFVALHSDLEVPCGCCVFQAGFRVEYGYTWGDILQRQSDVHEVNALINLGVRY